MGLVWVGYSDLAINGKRLEGEKIEVKIGRDGITRTTEGVITARPSNE